MEHVESKRFPLSEYCSNNIINYGQLRKNTSYKNNPIQKKHKNNKKFYKDYAKLNHTFRGYV